MSPEVEAEECGRADGGGGKEAERDDEQRGRPRARVHFDEQGEERGERERMLGERERDRERASSGAERPERTTGDRCDGEQQKRCLGVHTDAVDSCERRASRRPAARWRLLP